MLIQKNDSPKSKPMEPASMSMTMMSMQMKNMPSFEPVLVDVTVKLTNEGMMLKQMLRVLGEYETACLLSEID